MNTTGILIIAGAAGLGLILIGIGLEMNARDKKKRSSAPQLAYQSAGPRLTPTTPS